MWLCLSLDMKAVTEGQVKLMSCLVSVGKTSGLLGQF